MKSIRAKAEGLWDVGSTPEEIASALNVQPRALAEDPRMRKLLGLREPPRSGAPKATLNLGAAREAAERGATLAEIASAAGVTSVTWRSRARTDLDVAEIEAHRTRPGAPRRGPGAPRAELDLEAARRAVAAGEASVAAVAGAAGVTYPTWVRLAGVDGDVAEIEAERRRVKAARAAKSDELKDITEVDEKRLTRLACLPSTKPGDVAAALGVSTQRWRKLAARFPRAGRVDGVLQHGPPWNERQLRALGVAMACFTDERLIAHHMSIRLEQLRRARQELPEVAEHWRRNRAWSEEWSRLRDLWFARKLDIPLEHRGEGGSWPPSWAWSERRRAEFLAGLS